MGQFLFLFLKFIYIKSGRVTEAIYMSDPTIALYSDTGSVSTTDEGASVLVCPWRHGTMRFSGLQVRPSLHSLYYQWKRGQKGGGAFLVASNDQA
jgi:hypothetical protein